MGCVLPAGQGQAPARQAAHRRRLCRGRSAAVTVNKVCGSGLKAVVFGAQRHRARASTTSSWPGAWSRCRNAPYLLPKAREGLRLGHAQVIDSMIHDGLWDAYGNVHMGDCAELCAREKKHHAAPTRTRSPPSRTAARWRAQAEGKFAGEIVPVEIPQRKGPPKVVADDEEPGRGDVAKLAALRPAFQKDGTVTAGNASSINDGARGAGAGVGGRRRAARGWKPMARIVGAAGHAQAPEWFTTAPAGAIEQAAARRSAGTKDDVDLWEINEAFAVVSLANNRLLGLDPARVNVWGGAVALGHPIGASGARVLVTLLSALARRGASGGASPRCASAAARGSPWRSSGVT